MVELNWRKRTFFVFVLCAAAAIALPAQTFTVLHNFDGTDGDGTGITLAQGRDGNLYGSAVFAGPDGCGTAYRLTLSGRFEGLYAFPSQACTPTGGFALGPDGLFYANVQNGGASGGGGLFNLSAHAAFTLFANFDNTTGDSPRGLVLLGSDRNYYVTTGEGGTGSGGTFCKFTSSGVITVLHNFGSGPDDGFYPIAGPIEGLENALYGTTFYGGKSADGTVYEITRAGAYRTLVSFNGTDGANPYGGLLLASDGNFYGTAEYGGANGYGTLFKMNHSGDLSVLHNFAGSDGANPVVPLMQATDGKFYGTTAYGGSFGDGTVFSITTGGTLTVLHSFDGTDGANPYGTLTQNTNGTFYGTVAFGGAYGDGVLYSLDLGLGPFVKFLISSGRVRSKVQILGQGLTGTTSVSFNGTSATFKVASDTFLLADVPPGAVTGTVTVTTPGGTLSSNVPFRVLP